MKTRFLLPLACAAALAVTVPAYARNDAGRNMLIGGITGAIIGEHNDHRAAEGAFLGAAAGLLFTAITDNRGYDHRVVYYHSAPSYPPRHTVVVSRPYYPPPRVVVVHPAPYRHHSREVVIVRPAYRPAPRVVVAPHRDHDRRDRRDARYDNRNDRRDRRDDRRSHDNNRYSYNR